MNDDPEQLGPIAGMVLGPAAGMVEAASLRSQLAAALKRAEQAEAEMDRLYADLRKARWQGIRCAFDFSDYVDETEGRKES